MTLRPSEKSMCNYSSAKLELLALKWAVTGKFRDYLLGLKFTVYTDNNSLAYIQTSKLGVSQICWFSELALFDFNIIYRSGKSNQAADTLSQCPEPNCKLESDDSDNYSNDSVVLSYATICDIIKLVLGDTQIPLTIKKKAQAANNLLEGRRVCLSSMPYLTLQLRLVQSWFLIRYHWPYWPKPNLKILCWDWSFHSYVRGLNQRSWWLLKIRCKAARKSLLQFDRLVLKQGVLHLIYISNDVETHQLVLPLKISRNSTLYAAWWLQSSGIGPDFGSSEREILLEYDEPWCNWICHQLPLVLCCKGSLHRSAYTTGVACCQ